MGNARPPLSEELHDLVRDVVEDLESAAVACSPGRVVPRVSPATASERRRARQATILRLRPGVELPDVTPPTPAAAGPPPTPPAATAPPPPPPPPAQPHRQRAFLARLDVASAVFSARLPVRTRRIPVACRRASPLDAARASRMLRIAIPSLVIEPRTPLAPSPPPPSAWVTLLSPALPAPGPDEPVAVPQASPEPATATPIEVPDASVEAAATVTEAPASAPRETPAPTAPRFEDLGIAVPDELGAMAPSTTGARARAAVAAPPSRWRGPIGHATNLLIAVALEIVVMVCATMVGLIVTGHHLEEVVTGSMQPTIPIGSLVLTERIRANQLGVGDVVVFPDPNNTSLTIVHRIVWLSHDSQGDVLIKTKGDFNAVADNWTVKRPGTSYADRATWVLPGGGTAATWLRFIGFFGLLGLIIGFIGYQGWRQVRKVLATGDGDAVPVATEVA